MIIIDKNKDYYDYIAGIEGRDTDLVFDRRGSAIISKEIASLVPKVGEKFSLPELNGKDRDLCFEYFLMLGSWAGCLRHSVQLNSENVVLSIGEESCVHKFLPREDWPLCKIYKKHGGKNVPATIRVEEFGGRRVDFPKECIFAELTIYRQDGDSWKRDLTNHKWDNSILIGTKFASIFSAAEAWDHICEYLLSQREKPIVDNRTDVEKLEAAGFDKVTSFRNM